MGSLLPTITLKRLIQRGYESLLSYYEQISPQLNEPLYTRPAWPALRKEGYSGHAYAWLRQINVRGEPHQLILVGPSTRLVAVWPSPHFIRSPVFRPPLMLLLSL